MPLVRHFVRRMTTPDAADSREPDVAVAGVLALLAVPGAIYSFFLFDKYSTFLRVIRGGLMRMDVYTASLPDKYLFIASSMALTSVLVALTWDRILPGRADHSVLAALPIPMRTIFFANVAAIAFVAAVFIIDLNAVSSLLFPMVVMSDVPASLLDNIRFILAHACCVLFASSFAFLLCLSILAILMALVPATLFQRVSTVARFAIVCASCALLWTAFNFPHAFTRTVWVPPVWYTALYQVLQHRGTPAFQRLAFAGVAALAIAFLVASLGIVLSYRRNFMRIAESSTIDTSKSTLALAPLRFVLDHTLLRDGFDRALYWLGIRLLLRSEPHMMRFGALSALGFVIFTGQSMSGSDLMTASFPLAFLVVTGFRASIEIPAGAAAMSIFRLCAIRANPRPVLRKLLLTILFCMLAPVVIALMLTTSVFTGLLHAVFLGSLTLVAFDCMLFRYTGIPFTSISTGFQNSSLMIIALYFLAFLAFTAVGPFVEHVMLPHPLALAIAPFLPFFTSFLSRSLEKDEVPPDDGRVVQTLGIQA
jgi:hypothetical protein